MNAAEILVILQGDASAELKAKFLQETHDPQSDLNGGLVAIERWARTELNGNCPSPQIADDSASPDDAATPYRIIRKAAFWRDKQQRATPADLAAYIGGSATPEAVDLIKQALADPLSELSQLLENIKKKEI